MCGGYRAITSQFSPLDCSEHHVIGSQIKVLGPVPVNPIMLLEALNIMPRPVDLNRIIAPKFIDASGKVTVIVEALVLTNVIDG